jgi:hypothetical protein
VRKILVVVVLTVALGAVATAAAIGTDRVQVGGSSATRGFSRETFVAVTAHDAYTRTGFDGDHGDWRGPLCVVSSNPSLSSEMRMSWTIGFTNSYRTAEQAADFARTFRDMPTVERGKIDIPHRIRGKGVGDIEAHLVLAQTSQEYAWAEIGVAIPLTRGVFATARFFSSGPPFKCNVGFTFEREWHLSFARVAVEGVAIEGNLPAAYVTVHGRLRRVVGFVTDGFRHPVVRARVTIQRKVGSKWRYAGSALTDGSGFYSAKARPGRTRAVVASLRSRAVYVRGPVTPVAPPIRTRAAGT